MEYLRYFGIVFGTWIAGSIVWALIDATIFDFFFYNVGGVFALAFVILGLWLARRDRHARKSLKIA